MAARVVRRVRVDEPERFRLGDRACDDPLGLLEADVPALLAESVARIGALQERLYAQDRWAVLLLFQAMDAAGKDGTIKHVMSGINPQGCQVWSFKRPSEEELDHDWLWRSLVRLPERGRIGIHNRSWYEEVLVARVDPRVLAAQRLPETLRGGRLWEQRFESIRDVERHLARNGTLVLKFFLHVSKREQEKRLLARLDDPSKNWKFEAGDLVARQHWDDYMAAYDEAIRATSRPEGRWHVIPADSKPVMRLAVAAVLAEALAGLHLAFPEVTDAQRAQFARLRAELQGRPGPGLPYPPTE
jgi:PPK2 family polyphosphate:nucleotide phosphotransferase